MREEIVHLFQRPLRSLWQEDPEEYGICEVTNDEDEVVSVFDMLHRNGGDLGDHGVESEREHGG